MPSIEKHIEISKQRTGKPYRRLHAWIDDPEEREKRHDLNRILEFSREIAAEYGEEGAREYVQHIADDYNSKGGHTTEKALEIIEKMLEDIGSFV
jgi:hypothetical protein